MSWYREWFGEEYLQLYAHRDEREAQAHIAFFRDRVGPLDGYVLDLACGSGRHLVELRKAGYSAVGFDLSPTQLREARRANPDALLARADMRCTPFKRETFAGLVNFFTSFGYFDSETQNRGVVTEMHRVMKPGAPFLFDYLNVDRDLENLIPSETKSVGGRTAQIERWFDDRTRTFNKRIVIDGNAYVEKVRAYRLDEIREIFSCTGMSIEEVYGNFEGDAFDTRSPRLILLGRRDG